MFTDEDIPYRSAIRDQPETTSQVSSVDERNFDTLKTVRRLLSGAVDGLDKWHAFDLEDKEMNLKNQIKARQLAYDILTPLVEAIDSALLAVDDKYRQR